MKAQLLHEHVLLTKVYKISTGAVRIPPVTIQVQDLQFEALGRVLQSEAHHR